MSRQIRIVLELVLLVGGVIAYVLSGQVLILVAVAAFLVVSRLSTFRSMLGDTTRVAELRADRISPDGSRTPLLDVGDLDTSEIKRYRKEYPGASISDAIVALNARD
ncbi:hypothetical protein [Williamsia sp. CHRR-6]|uniref:hypothetical protein n=1 Tax=Williamsia sp. CHRR-6 TaxID=2835871 RepID=UPI001BD9444B|nr:hypothetical protein [Williamsia sp. CHRR-6]MBT0565935.1 hypothetical protein [Williamsia sp. CHRR-6]